MYVPSNAVVILVEGLGTSLVSAYGANTAHTPSLDRLAGRGLVLDQCYLDSNCRESQMVSLWTGRHAMQPAHASAEWTIWSELTALQIEHCLITDCSAVAAQAEQMGCLKVLLFDPTLNSGPANDVAECSLSGVFAAAATELTGGQARLIWIHSRGLRLPWDAPEELRSRFIDPEDPEPPADVGPPQFEITKDSDPDLVTGWGQVAAAQAALVDQSVAALLNAVATREDQARFSWLIGSLGGVSLGENHYVGFGSPIPHTEQLRAVSILCPAEPERVGTRRPELFQLPDLCPTLLELMGLNRVEIPGVWGRSCLNTRFGESPDRWPSANQLAVLSTDRWDWIRCPAWSAILEAGEVARLFVKPDDRWEVSDVANRRADISELLQEYAVRFRDAAEQGCRGNWAALPDELTNLLR